MTTSPSRWFLGGYHEDAPYRLICFPHAGASAGNFLAWQPQFGKGADLWALELPGHGRRAGEALADDIDWLVDEVAEAVRPLLDRPCVFLGHSLGALIAFELARRLRDPRVERLVVSACRAPRHLPSPRVKALAEKDDTGFLEDVRGFSGLPEEIFADEDLLSYFLPIVRADFGLVARYRYKPAPPLDVTIAAINGADDAHVPEDKLAAWQDETTRPLLRQTFPGDHFYLFEMPTTALADVLGLVPRSVA
jgi:surfactin synthase thioesterase subunit